MLFWCTMKSSFKTPLTLTSETKIPTRRKNLKYGACALQKICDHKFFLEYRIKIILLKRKPTVLRRQNCKFWRYWGTRCCIVWLNLDNSDFCLLLQSAKETNARAHGLHSLLLNSPSKFALGTSQRLSTQIIISIRKLRGGTNARICMWTGLPGVVQWRGKSQVTKVLLSFISTKAAKPFSWNFSSLPRKTSFQVKRQVIDFAPSQFFGSRLCRDQKTSKKSKKFFIRSVGPPQSSSL